MSWISAGCILALIAQGRTNASKWSQAGLFDTAITASAASRMNRARWASYASSDCLAVMASQVSSGDSPK